MNIEEMVPELFAAGGVRLSSFVLSSAREEKRVYFCQRCLNHGLHLKRKNHKSECQFRYCQCGDCLMISRRRELNCRLRADPVDEGVFPRSSSTQQTSPASPSECSSTPPVESPPNPVLSSDNSATNSKERRPNCQRCAQHNTQNRLKGHKRNCPFRDCQCAKCQVVVERQKLMADQIKLRRRQKKEKLLILSQQTAPSSPPHLQPEPTPTSSCSSTASPSGMCEKCAGQAMTYHQLMSLLDPSFSLDLLSTLALLFPICPHRNSSS